MTHLYLAQIPCIFPHAKKFLFRLFLNQLKEEDDLILMIASKSWELFCPEQLTRKYKFLFAKQFSI